MREAFFNSLYSIARKDKNVILLTADIGATCHDKFKRLLPRQYINMGVAEQNMIGVASGLALSGKKVYAYTIIPFLVMRCYEQIRVDICCMNLPVTLVGIGAGLDYSTLGPTHHAAEDISIMRALPSMTVYSPSDNLSACALAEETYKNSFPQYIRLDRVGFPLVYDFKKKINFKSGFSILKNGKIAYIIATGRMVFSALRVAKAISSKGHEVGVIDFFRLKPFNKEALWDAIKNVPFLVALEEHSVQGGVGTIVSEMLARKVRCPQLLSIGLPDLFCKDYGNREYVLSIFGLDNKSIAKKISNFLAGGKLKGNK